MTSIGKDAFSECSKLQFNEYDNAKYLGSAKNHKEYLPDFWRNITEEEKKLGHGGMDYFTFKAFFKAILNGEEMPIDVYDMATWMAITPLSEQSISLGGAPVAMPERQINISSFLFMVFRATCFFLAKTMLQDITRTTAVRIAVPRFDSTPEIPTFARIEVRAAKTAASMA